MANNKLWRVGFEEIDYIRKCINNGLNGDYTKEFESKFAKIMGVKYAIALNSGTSALHASLKAINIGYDDEVLVPPLTFIATAYAPIFVGAEPVFVDIDPKTFLIDPKKIEL